MHDIQLSVMHIQEPFIETQSNTSTELYDPLSWSDVHLEVGLAIKQGKLICRVFQLATLTKLLTMLVLIAQGFPCDLPHKIWLSLMMSYDLGYFIQTLCVMYSSLIWYSKYLDKTPMRFLQVNYDPTDPEYQDTNLSGFIIGQCLQHFYRPINGVTAITSCEHYFKCLGATAELLRVYYILLFIFGNIFLYIGLVEGPSSNIFLGFLFVGYLYLFIPILLCISWPCLVIIVFCVQMRQQRNQDTRQKPLKEKLFKKLLKPQNYNMVADSDIKQSCAICYVDYDDTHMIISLPCNPGHYFHQDCCQKWLKINGTCPICRQNVEKLLQERQ